MRAAGSVAVHGNMRNSPEAGHIVRARSRWYKVLRQGGGSAPGGAEPPQLEATGGRRLNTLASSRSVCAIGRGVSIPWLVQTAPHRPQREVVRLLVHVGRSLKHGLDLTDRSLKV